MGTYKRHGLVEDLAWLEELESIRISLLATLIAPPKKSTSFEGRTWEGRVKYADIGPSIDAIPLTSGFFGYAHDLPFGDVVDPIFGLLYYCIEYYVSRLILRPNLAYNSTFNCVISSLIVPSCSSNAVTSSSIFVVDNANISWTSGRGSEMKESPILYLEGTSDIDCS
jgi:hypothetical protein